MMQLVGLTELRGRTESGAIATNNPYPVPVLHFINSKVIAMNIIRAIGAAVSYFFDGCIELFSPNHDDYPASGVQPFEGKTTSRRSALSRRKRSD
jgi:hypothetical protein